LEKLGLITAEQIATAPIHPDVKLHAAVNISTGSLGQGLPIAMGMALAEPNRQVYCLISDGECYEGSIWESLRFAARHPLPNLTILLNANGWSAYDAVDLPGLYHMIKSTGLDVAKVDGHSLVAVRRALKKKSLKTKFIWCETTVNQLPGISDLAAHYQALTEQTYQAAVEVLK
jgi:transketolase N-terminal domain/subunit